MIPNTQKRKAHFSLTYMSSAIKMPKHWISLLIISMTIVILVIHFPSLSLPFYQDDYNLLEMVAKGDIRDYIRVSFTKPDHLLPLNLGVVFRPIPHFIFFDISYKFFDLNPLPFRLVNLSLLLTSGLLVGMYTFIITRRCEVAFLTGILLVSSRVFFEPVYWISANNEIFLTLFVVSSTLAYLAAREQNNLLLDLVSILTLLCGLLSKETAIVTPVLIGLSILMRSGSWNTRERIMSLVPLWPHTFLVIGFLALRLPYITHALDGGGDSYYATTSLYSIISSYIWGVWWSIESFVEPWRSMINTLTKSFSIFQPIYVGVAAIITIFIYLTRLIKHRLYTDSRIIVLGITWFIVAASPPLYTGILSSYIFSLSTVGFCIILATVVETVFRKISKNTLLQRYFFVSFGLLCVFSAYSFVTTSASDEWPARDMRKSAQILEDLREMQFITGVSEICVIGIPESAWYPGRLEPALHMFSNPNTIIHEISRDTIPLTCPPGSVHLLYKDEGFEVLEPL